MVNFDRIFYIGRVVSVVVAALSGIGSTSTLLLIRDMKCWNLYMRFLFQLTSCQLISDVAFFFSPYHNEGLLFFRVQVFAFSFGALSVALWTNLISCSLFSVVVYQENFSPTKRFATLRILVVIPGLIVATLFALLIDTRYKEILSVLIWTQIASILFNILVHAAVSIKLYKMRLQSYNEAIQYVTRFSNLESDTEQPLLSHHEAEELAGGATNIYEPVSELARRLQYYPIVQIVSLLGQVYYFLAYNMNYFGTVRDDTRHVLAWYAYSILTPSAGIGYFIVFLSVQPFAYSHLCMRIRSMCGASVGRSTSSDSDMYREPRTTNVRVNEEGRNNSNEDSSVSSLGTFNTGLTSAHTHLTGNTDHTYASMDDETLMKKIGEYNEMIGGEKLKSSSSIEENAL
jgi:hypothetical protein